MIEFLSRLYIRERERERERERGASGLDIYMINQKGQRYN
jgi:hypothetical protein